MAEPGRLLTAMVTPMTASRDVDYTKARVLARRLIATGSDGLVIGGTTGESPSLSAEERLRLIAEVKESVGPNVAVVAGTTDNNHGQSLELSREAERIGADAILCTVPAYTKPQQDGLFLHFRAIAESVSLPCILYNVPSRTAVNMEAATTRRLAEIDNVIGVKEASTDAVQIATIIDRAPDGFRVWSGNDNQTFAVLCLGGYGVVSVAGNLVGKQVAGMMAAVRGGDVPAAAAEHRRLLPLFEALFWRTSPVPVKYAMTMAGFDVGPTRLPLAPPDQNFVEGFDAVAREYSLDLVAEA